MKKLFFANCFVLSFFAFINVYAGVSTIEEAAEQSAQPKPLVDDIEGLPNPQDVDEVRKFFKKRFEEVNVSDANDLGDLNKANAINIQHSAEYINDMKESQKSPLEKIYDEAMKRIDAPGPSLSPDTVFYERVKKTNTQEPNAPLMLDFPVVNVSLPNGENIIAPAQEHIPYLLASYSILPTGLIDVDEQIVVVANGNKLKDGLKKSMQKFSISRTKVKKKLDVTLLSVSINGKEVPYKLSELGNMISFVPKEHYALEPGIYTYRFHYLLDRKLWYYPDFTEFYTDVAGSYGLVIGSANAIVSVSEGKTFTSSAVLSGYASLLTPDRAVTASLSENALGFASTDALNVGESMHVLVSLDKDVFVSPGLGRRFVWFVTDWGDVLFSFLGALLIYISYMLSWKYIKENKSRLNIRLKQKASLNRYILDGLYDKRSFVATLLELFYYKVMDFSREGQKIVLLKKTDNLKKISHSNKRIVKILFGKSDSAIEIDEKTALKMKRAYMADEKYTKRAYHLLTFALNVFYLVFSLSMLMLTIYAISRLGVNPLETALILSISVVTMMFYFWVLEYPYRTKIKKYLFKTISWIFIALNVLFLSVYIHFISAVFFGVIAFVVVKYSKLFANKDGLIKNKRASLESLKQNYITNAPQISEAMNFEAQQATIFALEADGLYNKSKRNERIYRLDYATDLLKIL